MKPLSRPYGAFIARASPRTLLNGIMAACGAGFLLFGYDQGVMSGLLASPPFQAQFPRMADDATLQGQVVALYEIGCFAGALATFWLGERLGRRRMIIYGMLVLSLGAVIQASSFDVPQLIVGRIVAGVGNGFTTATIPVYHSETSKAHDRGRAVCIELAVNIAGVCTSYWIDYGFSFIHGSSVQWRFPLAFQVFFALVTVGLISFMPESPRWLLLQGRDDEALDVLRMLDVSQQVAEEVVGKGATTPDAAAPDAPAHALDYRHEFDVIKATIEEERALSAGSPPWRDIFRNSGKERYLQRALLGMGSQFAQQLSGINLITYYAPVIFQQSVGFSHNLSLLMSGFNGLAYFFSSLVPIFLIERLGRRPLMLFGAAGQMGCMAVLAAMTVSVGDTAKGIVATVMLFLFNFFFSVGWLAIPWLYPAEINPMRTRTQGAALATCSNWIFTYLVVCITPPSVQNIGYKTYVMFAIFNASFIVLTFFFYPETKGLTLESVDKLFEETQAWSIGPVDTRRYNVAAVAGGSGNTHTLAASPLPSSSSSSLEMCDAEVGLEKKAGYALATKTGVSDVEPAQKA
ncbi:uncharacterized protein PFL1_02186 [Pseudozyma flocculosa PF-1]|uniref:Related to sugar transporter n=1 Tax=Pseudozyma flocculosa TaxID=84751 RepID=A0A5C3FAI5_9BASI|nr:uncharacterized protein PFL1_02186 [Pseudozyma flocculosa PF-1]EPQ30069.1 hypothetical protein PFL1_02186 [Pseudozyma flocculosa PF-1]SPO41412.1 related to sugar transporter [Pseudozyma flocculosa]